VSPFLAVDWGTKRLGLAVSDPTGLLARALPTLMVDTPGQAALSIAEIAHAEGANTIILGLPLNMNGSEGTSARSARELGGALEQVGFTVTYHDERLTSEEALEYLRQQGVTRPEKERVDQVAALLLLQNYLDHRPRGEGCA
jgi:putative Holliday junction resolvase